MGDAISLESVVFFWLYFHHFLSGIFVFMRDAWDVVLDGRNVQHISFWYEILEGSKMKQSVNLGKGQVRCLKIISYFYYALLIPMVIGIFVTAASRVIGIIAIAFSNISLTFLLCLLCRWGRRLTLELAKDAREGSKTQAALQISMTISKTGTSGLLFVVGVISIQFMFALTDWFEEDPHYVTRNMRDAVVMKRVLLLSIPMMHIPLCHLVHTFAKFFTMAAKTDTGGKKVGNNTVVASSAGNISELGEGGGAQSDHTSSGFM